MIIDTSALIALLEGEPEAEAIAHAIERTPIRRISAPTLLECHLIAHRRGEAGSAMIDAVVARANIEVVPFAEDDVVFARAAFVRYGKGRHPAGLNFGDCFAYALAQRLGEPLLFKGDDFRQTDITSALS